MFLISEFLPFWTSRTSTSSPQAHHRAPVLSAAASKMWVWRTPKSTGQGKGWLWSTWFGNIQDVRSASGFRWFKLETTHQAFCPVVLQFVSCWCVFASKHIQTRNLHLWMNSCHHVLTRYLSLAEVLAEHGRSWKNHESAAGVWVQIAAHRFCCLNAGG